MINGIKRKPKHRIVPVCESRNFFCIISEKILIIQKNHFFSSPKKSLQFFALFSNLLLIVTRKTSKSQIIFALEQKKK